MILERLQDLLLGGHADGQPARRLEAGVAEDESPQRE
jgi:hypothetical protein